MKKNTALALLLSALHFGIAHGGDSQHMQPGAFPPPSCADLMGPEGHSRYPQVVTTGQGQFSQTAQQQGDTGDLSPEEQQRQDYAAWLVAHQQYVAWYNYHYGMRSVVPVYAVPVTVQPSSQPTHTTDSHAQRTTINCCVIGDNCCLVAANGNDECRLDCPVRVGIKPWVDAALNLFTCGAAAAKDDGQDEQQSPRQVSEQQLRELQGRNPGMKSSALAGLLAAGPRVVTKDHLDKKAHQE